MNDPFTTITKNYIPRLESKRTSTNYSLRHIISEKNIENIKNNIIDPPNSKIKNFSFLFKDASNIFYKNKKVNNFHNKKKEIYFSKKISNSFFNSISKKNEDSIKLNYEDLIEKLQTENNHLKKIEIQYYKLTERFRNIEEKKKRYEIELKIIKKNNSDTYNINIENFREKIIKLNSEKLNILNILEIQKTEIRNLKYEINFYKNNQEIKKKDFIKEIDYLKEKINNYDYENLSKKIKVKDNIIQDLRHNLELIKKKKCKNCNIYVLTINNNEKKINLLQKNLNLYRNTEKENQNNNINRKKKIYFGIKKSIVHSLLESKSSYKYSNFNQIEKSPIKKTITYCQCLKNNRNKNKYINGNNCYDCDRSKTRKIIIKNYSRDISDNKSYLLSKENKSIKNNKIFKRAISLNTRIPSTFSNIRSTRNAKSKDNRKSLNNNVSINIMNPIDSLNKECLNRNAKNNQTFIYEKSEKKIKFSNVINSDNKGLKDYEYDY